MKAKKTNSANLEKKKIMFFEYGLILALATMLVAFESGSKIDETNDFVVHSGEIADLVLPPITGATPPPPPPPIVNLTFEIVDHAEIIEDIPDFNIEPSIEDLVTRFNYEKEEEEEEVEIITCTVCMSHPPKFQGDDVNAFQAYVQKQLNYKEEAIRLGLEGRVIAQFIIDEKGNLVQAKILRGIDPMLDNEVIRALKNSPKWQPGKQNAIPVKVQFVIPVIFRLK